MHVSTTLFGSRVQALAPLRRAALLAVLTSFACSIEAESGTSPTEPVRRASESLDSRYFYLRCNSTGWGVDGATRLVPTADQSLLRLTYDVTLPWLIGNLDNCQLTETNQSNGWGTSQRFYGTPSWEPVHAPGTGVLLQNGGSFTVSYPALGRYTFTLNPGTGAFSITTGGGCGNAACEAGESCGSCPADCGPCGPSCGDTSCAAGETCFSCAADCGPCTQSPSAFFADPNHYLSVKAQLKYQTVGAAYDLSSESIKAPWANWSNDPNVIPNKPDLLAAIDDAWSWLQRADRFANFAGQPATALTPTGSGAETEADDLATPRYYISLEEGWQLYLWWVSHDLALDLSGELPWSLDEIASLDPHHLAALFDSTEMFRRRPSDDISLGSGPHPNFFGTPWESYSGYTIIGTPRFTLRFLVENDLLKPTRIGTIRALLDWASTNLVHFFGADTRANAEEHWGHRYFPTVEKIVEGTTRTGETAPRHWTMGCHGSSQFFKDVLRAANVPVRVPFMCGHAEVWFPTEDLFVDHGDDPYNLDYVASACTADHILVDGPTFSSLFGPAQNHDEGTFCLANPSPVGFHVRPESLAVCQ